MRSIDLRPYDVVVETPEGSKTVPYGVQKSLAVLLFAEAGLKALDLLRRDDLARAVLAVDADTTPLLIEDADYEFLVTILHRVEGLSRNDVGLVRRVLEAERVQPRPVEFSRTEELPALAPPSLPPPSSAR